MSHFGSMVTVFGSDKDTNDGILDNYSDELIKVIESNEFVFILCEVLYLEYPYNNWIVDEGIDSLIIYKLIINDVKE